MKLKLLEISRLVRISQRSVTNGLEKSASWFYQQNAIEDAAERNTVGIQPNELLQSCMGNSKDILIKNAQFLQSEIPVRIAKRVLGFRNLPFIISSNPSLLKVQELYINSFHHLEICEPVIDAETEEIFRQTLVNVLDDHKNTIKLLSLGFKECQDHVPNQEFVRNFLDNLLKARLGMRLLCDHHIMLGQPRDNYFGCFDLNFSPAELIRIKIREVKMQCDLKYGAAPEIKVQGHLDSNFAYIPSPLDYIVGEVLKNSVRAVIEAKDGGYIEDLEPVVVTLVNNESFFMIRVEDRGAGISAPELKKIWNYGYSGTTRAPNYDAVQGAAGGESDNNFNIFGAITENRMAGTLYGYGFGLPVCRAYASYMGGGMKLETMLGLGTSVYIKLRHLENSGEHFTF